MKSNRFKGLWQAMLLTGVLFSGALCASTGVEEAQARLARYESASSAYETHCANRLAMRGMYDPTQGAEHIALIRALNDRLEARAQRGSLTLKDLFEEGIIEYSPDPVTDKSEKAQSMPYRELRFLHTFTAAFVPTTKKGADIDLANYDGMIIALPGIGFEVSVARSLFEIAGTFNNGKNPALSIPGANRRLRMISIPMDAPLNGMGEDAPFGLGHPDGVMEVIRHAVLVFQTMFPGKKTFIIGRSQGGLNAFEASAKLRGIVGVIPLNASNPEVAIVRECIRRHDEMAKPDNIEQAQASGFSCKFHEKSWYAHEVYTPLYQVLQLPSRVPSLHLMGSKDWSYPPEYTDSWNRWAAQDPRNRRIAVFNGAHNLWMRPRGDGERLFGQVVAEMTKFISEILGL